MAEYFFNPWSIPYFLSFFICISVVALLLYKKRENKLVQLFVITEISLAGLSLAAAMATCSRNPGIWDVWNSINNVAAVLAVTTYYHFSYVSLTKKGVIENKKFLLIYVLPLFFLLFVTINPEHTIGEYPDTDLGLYGKDFTGQYSFYKPILYTSIGLMLGLTIVNFIKMFRQSLEQIPRRRALYFILSSFIPFIGFTISVLLVEIFYIYPHIQLGMVALSISGIIITWGILKDRLFDIEFFVKKTFTYLLIVVILIAIFKLIELALSHFITSTFFASDLTVRLIATAVVAGIFFPLRFLAIKIGDKLFPELSTAIRYDQNKKLSVYKKQLEHALEDGTISEKEQRMLKSLREDLKISDEEHNRLVKEITHNINRK